MNEYEKVIRTYVLKDHALLWVSLLLNCCILVRNVNTVAAHYHLVVELVIMLIHLQLLSYRGAEYAASQSVYSKAWWNIKSTVVARGANSLMNGLIGNLMLLRLTLTRRLQCSYWSYSNQGLIAIFCLSLRHFSIRSTKAAECVWLHVQGAGCSVYSSSHQYRLSFLWTTSITAVIIIRVVVHLMTILVWELNLWRNLHISILLLC